jgi:hypothetical protein
VLIRRGWFRRPVVVGTAVPAAPVATYSPVVTAGYAPTPAVVGRPVVIAP